MWLIIGAGRGMGVEFTRAALAAGRSVVASGRDPERVSKVLGTSSDLLAVTLGVTSVADAEAAVRAAVARFGRIDVLVNNAACFFAGYFEELTPAQIGKQLAASRATCSAVAHRCHQIDAVLPDRGSSTVGFCFSAWQRFALDERRQIRHGQ